MGLIQRDELVKRLRRIGRRLCKDDMYWLNGVKAPKPETCTCELGTVPRKSKLHFIGSPTGCPEARLAAALIAELTESGYQRLMKRRKKTIKLGTGETYPMRRKRRK